MPGARPVAVGLTVVLALGTGAALVRTNVVGTMGIIQTAHDKKAKKKQDLSIEARIPGLPPIKIHPVLPKLPSLFPTPSGSGGNGDGGGAGGGTGSGGAGGSGGTGTGGAGGTGGSGGGSGGTGGGGTGNGSGNGGNGTGVHGMLFGAWSSKRPGETVTQAFEKLQQQVGRKFNVHRTYAVWDTPEPTGLVKWDLANGYIPALSIKAVTKSGKRIKWADIAAGKQDATIISQARALKATGKRIILTFHHEPENDPANGTPADFVAAWRHYVTVFRQQGASNVEFNWIMMTYTFNPQSHKNPDAWYPGDQWVDWIGGDGYNMFGCQPHAGWKSFADAFQYWRAWAAKHPSKPLFIAEWGSMEKPGDPNAKAQWFRDAAKTLAGWSQVHAVTYYDANHKCSWFADSSQQSLAAYAQLARASQQEATFVNR